MIDRQSNEMMSQFVVVPPIWPNKAWELIEFVPRQRKTGGGVMSVVRIRFGAKRPNRS